MIQYYSEYSNHLISSCCKYDIEFHSCSRRPPGLYGNRAGGMILSLMVAVIALAVIFAYILNIGAESIERQKMQHAADTVVYSSSVWLARGMNTVASLNHVMGDNSAYCALIESLAGSEVAFEPCVEERDMNKRLKLKTKYLCFEDESPCTELADESMVKDAIKLCTDHSFTDSIVSAYPEDILKACNLSTRQDLHTAGGACYDSEMLLKYYITECMTKKAIATVFMEGQGHGFLSALEPVGLIIHLSCNYLLNGAGLGSFGNLNGLLGQMGLDISGFIDLSKFPGFSNITGAIGDIQSQIGNINNQFDTIASNITNLGNQIGGIGDKLSGFSDQVGSLIPDLSSLDLPIDLTENLKGIQSILDEYTDPINTLKDKIQKIAPNIKGLDAANITDKANGYCNKLTNYASQLEKLQSELQSKLSSKLNSLKDKISKCGNLTTDLANKLNNLTSGLTSALSNGVNSITSIINGVSDKLSGIGGNLSKLTDMLGSLNLGNLNSNGGFDTILGSLGGLGSKGIIQELKDIHTLEKTLGDSSNKKDFNGKIWSHGAREELRTNINKVNMRFPNIVGSDKEDPKERILYKHIYATAEEIKKVYGFDACVIAPLDTLVSSQIQDKTTISVPEPDSKKKTDCKVDVLPSISEQNEAISKEREEKITQFLNDHPIIKSGLKGTLITIDEIDKALGRNLLILTKIITWPADLWDSLMGNEKPNETHQFLLGLLSEARDKYNSQKGNFTRMTVCTGCVDGCPCHKLIETYNKQIDELQKYDSKIEELNKLYEEGWGIWTWDSALQCWKFTKAIVSGMITVASKGKLSTTTQVNLGKLATTLDVLDFFSDFPAIYNHPENAYEVGDARGIKLSMSATKKIFEDILAGKYPALKNSMMNKLKMSANELDNFLMDGVILTKAIGLGQAGLTIIYTPGKQTETSNKFNETISNLINAYTDAIKFIESIKQPVCQCDIEKDPVIKRVKVKPEKFPLLPVLAEDISDTGTIAASGNLRHERLLQWYNTSWRSNYGSQSVYDTMPKIPWTGNYDDTKVPNTLKTLDMTIMAGQAVIAAYIAACIAQYNFGEAAYASGLLSRTILLQFYLTPDWKPGEYGHLNNPSVWSYPRGCFDYEAEQKSQWVRAAYPVADELRGGLVAHYKKDLPISNIATFLSAWSWRYVLSESYYNRTAVKRPYNVYNIPKPCYMYVIAGTDPENKGDEPFWSDEKIGAEIIDQMFCIAAAIEPKKHKPNATPVYFSRFGQEKRNTTVAQAMFYSATGRNSKSSGKLNTSNGDSSGQGSPQKDCQPCTGWDTLQWQNFNEGEVPVFKAKEWWNSTPGTGEEMDYAGLTTSNPIKRKDGTKLQFNWQAMLCPVTKSRVEKLAEDNSAHEDLKISAESAANHSNLFTH